MAKQNISKLLIFILLSLTILSTVACVLGTIGLQSQIVGQWVEQSGTGLILEFFDDGTVTATILGVSTAGDYSCIDDHTIRIDLTGILGSVLGAQTFEVAIDGDAMTLAANGMNFQFARLK